MRLTDVNLLDPDRFAEGTPHDQFALLRREAPVHFHPEPGGAGFWCLTKYTDVRHVSKHPELFSSQRQGTMIKDPAPHDLPLIQASILIIASIYCTANLIADILYAYFNPKIRYGRAAH